MDLTPTQRSLDLTGRLLAFMREFVYPAEEVYARQRREGDPHRLPPVVTELQAEARARGLWNLFLRDQRWGAGLTNLEYAPLAEISGRSPVIAPEAMNCSASPSRARSAPGSPNHAWSSTRPGCSSCAQPGGWIRPETAAPGPRSPASR